MKQFLIAVLIAVLMFSVSGHFLFKADSKYSIGRCWHCHKLIYDNQNNIVKKYDYTIIEPGPFTRYLVLYTKYIILHEECCKKANTNEVDSRNLITIIT